MDASRNCSGVPAPSLRVVLVCTSFGQHLAQELGQHATCKPGKKPCVAKGLLPVGGAPLVNYWKRAAEATPRCLPIEQKVFVLCNDDNHDDYVRWATNIGMSEGGFPVENIISNGTSGSQRNGIMSDIACFVEKTGGGATDLVVIECDYLFHPAFNLQRVVEHSLMRGKDTITFLNLADEQNQSQHNIVEFASHGTNPKVSCIKPFPRAGESRSLAAVAPLLVLRKSTIPKVCECAPAMAAECSSPLDAAAKFYHWLPSAVPVYALNVGHVFDCKTFDSYSYLDLLFQYYIRKKTGAPEAPKQARHVVCHTDFTTMFSGGDLAKRLREADGEDGGAGEYAEEEIPAPKMTDPGALDLEEMLPAFNTRYMTIMEEKAADAKNDRNLPVRFADATLRKHNPTSQHPVYTTSNWIYGSKASSQHEMPTKFYGLKAGVTATFPIVGPGNKMDMYRDTSFVCSATTSKVHKSLDDF
uniref:Uncharacterized protein n=1 Tax=Pyramimonas obovata TaxID=1411642 RepID=A0A7S0RUM4_9CHLO|eukprot:CAMPEP_0118929208 /NCGR_PEP_ID=MMETSP1169-20130426/6265_1 /TAXON_ID=36882 /ORGANISM="Pyramimonas obovata, Strain CCMP722" /LENGTH=470 /DNA_ID=CAMNT_0006871349 /DNA_START=30 /DNA_END=1442 /DNA_ORIENTATION=-